MDLEDAGTRVKFVLHDRDASFTLAFGAVFQAAGVRVIRSAVQAPRMNSIMERWIGSCRRELLDRTLIWNRRQLMIVLREYEDFYNTHRPHRTPARPRRCARYPMTSPTWISSGFSGVTAQVVQSRFHRKRRSGCCEEREGRSWPSRWVMSIGGAPELHG
jgi:Integrase core domain